MTKSVINSVAVLALAAIAVVPALAETPEAAAKKAESALVSAQVGVAASPKAAWKSLKQQKAAAKAETKGFFRDLWNAFKQDLNREVDWSNHPCKPDEIREDGGDSGIICRSKQKYEVSCTITQWDEYQGEGGPYRVPHTIDSCTCNGKPCNGFAGDGPSTPGEQAP